MKRGKTIGQLKKGMALCLGMTLVLSVLGFAGFNVKRVNAQGELSVTDAFCNQWARSDLRAWMNGLTKENGNMPIDGSNGTKNASNFLNSFTDAELSLFQPKTVITNVFNDSKVLDSSNDDKALTRTTSIVQTKDRFWAASGLLMHRHVNTYEGQLVSADPGYDLSNYYTYKQKVKNGKDNKWKNIVPIAFWGGNPGIYDSISLRSPSFEETTEVICSDSGYNIEGHDVDDSWIYAGACGCIALPSRVFAAMALSSESGDGKLIKKEIAQYDKLGRRNNSGKVPDWGMHLKSISLDSIRGKITYDSTNEKLAFSTDDGLVLPQGKYLMVQAYKNWDYSKTDDDGTDPETLNAKSGDTVYVAGKILGDSDTSAEFTDAPDLKGYTVKVWVEDEPTNEQLAQASAPLAFSIDATGKTASINEAKSMNPRVFAYKSDLSCSWGIYNTEDECTFISHGEARFNENRPYEGKGATYQKLYIGTDSSGKPIEWWIAGRDVDELTLYQYSGLEYKEFNDSMEEYKGRVKNPSLYLFGDFTNNDIDNFISKVKLSKEAIEKNDPSDCDGENEFSAYEGVYDESNILDVSAEKLSLQFCKTNGSEWTNAASGVGDYYVRVAFAGEEIDGVEYAPCYSNVRKINIPPVYVTGINTSFSDKTVTCGEIFSFSGSVSPDNAYDKKLKWSVSSGSDRITLYQDKDCKTALTSTTEIDSGTTVYAKASDNTGQATITATTVGLDSNGLAKTKSCTVTVSRSNNPDKPDNPDKPENPDKPINPDKPENTDDDPVPVTVADATVTGIVNWTYTGSALTQNPKVTVDGTVLSEGVDYTLSYANNVNVGTATMTITGIGDYTGTKDVPFKILKASQAKDMKNATVEGVIDKTYTGKAITQNITVNLGGKNLKKKTDYTVSYKNNKKAGTATITITGKGEIKGKKTVTFKINKAENSLKIKGKTASVKEKDLKKKSKTLAVKKVIKVSKKGQGKLKYVKESGDSRIKINKNSGIVTVKKGTPAGTYPITAKVTAAGDANHDKTTKEVTFTVRIT
ncbi:MAG: hypothetical protein IK152_01720, partial [Lachnospiraceae bacterium]|nr:hypothetical protein [Lachnospiraceae bacterium]